MARQELKTTEEIRETTNVEEFAEMYAKPFCFRGFYSPTAGIMSEDELLALFCSDDVISQEIIYDREGRFMGLMIEIEDYPLGEISKFEDEVSFDEDAVGHDGEEAFDWYTPPVGDESGEPAVGEEGTAEAVVSAEDAGEKKAGDVL